MRSIQVHFEDKEFDILAAKKKDKSWHDFIVERCS